MSNTPVLVDEAMSVISAGPLADRGAPALAEQLLRPVGKVLRIPESQQDAATALSGSGPAYVYFLVEAMVDAGILLGMPRSTALEMVKQAVYGAATMLRDSGEHPVLLREAVTSPGGTTINAIRELERHGVRAASWRLSRQRGIAAANWARASHFRIELQAFSCRTPGGQPMAAIGSHAAVARQPRCVTCADANHTGGKAAVSPGCRNGRARTGLPFSVYELRWIRA